MVFWACYFSAGLGVAVKKSSTYAPKLTGTNEDLLKWRLQFCTSNAYFIIFVQVFPIRRQLCLWCRLNKNFSWYILKNFHWCQFFTGIILTMRQKFDIMIYNKWILFYYFCFKIDEVDKQ